MTAYPILSGLGAEIKAWANAPNPPWWSAVATVAFLYLSLMVVIGGLKAFWRK